MRSIVKIYVIDNFIMALNPIFNNQISVVPYVFNIYLNKSMNCRRVPTLNPVFFNLSSLTRLKSNTHIKQLADFKNLKSSQ